MSYYHVCPYCGATLDPGERCDCRNEDTGRLLSVDYKDKSGTDYAQNIAICQNSDITDEQLVELIREQYAKQGLTVSAIIEIMSGPRVLYIRPGFLEEGMLQQGLPIPENMPAAMEAAGIHPVNWDERM